jgi:hypothetical protein
MLQTINYIRESEPEIYSNLRQQLEQYKQIIDSREDVPLIIKNEIIIPEVGIPDIEVFGGRMLIEVKVKASEFGEGFEQLSRYAPFYPYAEYAIITDYSSWEFFRVQNGKLAKAGKIDLSHMIHDILIKGVKISLTTEKVGNMFHPIVLLKDELHQIFKVYEVKNDALFKAYRDIMKRLYEKASEEEIEELFIKHTLMQMIVSSCLTVSSQKRTTAVKACSGDDIEAEIVLPYLKWWGSLEGRMPNQCDREFLNSLVESIYSRAMLLDWESGGEDDVFRMLYEILIDKETRRKIGEYYTPLWLVEYMVNKLSKDVKDLKGKTVLDPFCGSGTFLVTVFYKKVQEGETPDDAIREVIGFDINPLAVSIARAELMIAYQSKRAGTVTPLVFNTDSAGLLLRTPERWEPTSFLEELKELEKSIEYVNSPLYASTHVDFSEILKIETILREYFRHASRTEDIKSELNTRLDELKKGREWKGALTGHIVETLMKKKNVNAIAELIEKYGNGVWATSITSLFAPQIIRKVKVDIVITNPPWAQLTEPKGSYGQLMREKAKELLQDYEKTGQILVGSDISSVLLYGCTNIANCEVVFLMPDEVVYTAGSYYGLGKILTYSVMKDCNGEVVQVKYDAFQHGRLPCIVFLGKEDGKITCYSMDVEWKGEYSKALHLSHVKCVVRRRESFQNYIRKVKRYTEFSTEAIREALSVEQVNPKGNYIMGLFGGKKKIGAKPYAGLVFSMVAEDRITKQYTIKLYGTSSQIKIQEFFLNPYWKKLIYAWDIFPFYLNRTHNLVLSSKGKEDLKEFLKTRILEKATQDDKRKVEVLIKEFKQPERLGSLKQGRYYVIYRGRRTFASFVLTPDKATIISKIMKHEIVLDDNCSSLSIKDELTAYYYSTILNYLAYKVKEIKGVFERAQYLRPLIAIATANLDWKGKQWQLRIAKLGKQLHQEAPKCLKHLDRGTLVQKCFEKLETCDETRELLDDITRTVDKSVDKKKLYQALKFVCTVK